MNSARDAVAQKNERQIETYEAVQRLAKAGQREEAHKLASTIHSTVLRDLAFLFLKQQR